MVPDIIDTEVITAFINGLEIYDDLRKKLHCKKVKMVTHLYKLAQE